MNAYLRPVGQAKRAAASLSIPLSAAPRAPKRIPTFAALARPAYEGDFASTVGRVVGLHIHRSWGLAKKIAADGLDISLERDPDNDHDSANAVVCYLPARDGNPRATIGYLDAETAAIVARELDAGAPLAARPAGSEPWAGANSRGGSLEVVVALVG